MVQRISTYPGVIEEIWFQITARSSPVSSANFRCFDMTHGTLTASKHDKKLMELDKSCSFSLAALIIVCNIWRGSPWLTINIAHLQKFS
ncbi:hypothetical protein SOVF_012340, partial [Spinacia oleracea]